jgi:ABC-2 type transport system permease protein
MTSPMATEVDALSRNALIDLGTRQPNPNRAVTLKRVIRSEWTKLRSVRSTLLGFTAAGAIAIVLGLVLSSVASSGSGSGTGGGHGGTTDPVSLSLSGFTISQLIVGVLGVLFVTSEYSSGMIRSTFSVVTRRGLVLRAKVIVFGAVSFASMTAVAFLAYFGGTALYKGHLVVPSITDPAVFRAVIGTGAYTMGIGLIGIALGFLLRSTAAAIGVLVAGVLIVPSLIGLIPGSIGTIAAEIMPSDAGSSFTTVSPGSNLLQPAVGALVFALWIVVLLGAAGLSLLQRDA